MTENKHFFTNYIHVIGNCRYKAGVTRMHELLNNNSKIMHLRPS